MTTKFRILALAAMSLGAAVSAQAASLNFEDLAIEALGNTPPGAPLLLTNQISGFSFIGATVYHVDQDVDPYPKPEPKTENGVGFIQNRDGVNLSTTYQTVSFRLAGALANDDIETFSFDVAKGTATILDVLAFGKDANGADVRKEYVGVSGSSSWVWGAQSLADLAGLGLINRIDFVVRNVGTVTPVTPAFALDNFNYTLAGTGGGGSVPEPAGLGLVALALAAAGFTTRKRRV